MTSLSKFLAELSINPFKLAEFIKDPNAVMEAAGIDEQAKRALRSGSGAAMWDVLLDRPMTALADITLSPALSASARRGSLIVVGTGIRTVGHLTLEAIAWIKESDVVLYLVADPIAEEAIRHLNPNGAMSLRGYYGEGVHRSQSYEAMVQHILSCVRAEQRTCVAFYGHPGVFAYPSHESIRRARQEGYNARMLPGISAEDCLFADLGVDPAVNGCQSFEATDFLLHVRTVDTSSQLVLWQVGVVGDWTYRANGYDLGAFPLLMSRLCELYGPYHEGFIYEAAVLPGLAPSITRIAMGSLTPAYVNAGSTLYIPPSRGTTVDLGIATAMGLRR
jgi:precorrin-6B methylase 1